MTVAQEYILNINNKSSQQTSLNFVSFDSFTYSGKTFIPKL
jgi:hypothetical protein